MRFTFLLITSFLISFGSIAQEDPMDFYNKGYEYMYTDKDSSYYFFEKAITSYEALEDADYQFASLLGLMFANGYYYDLKSYKKNLDTFEKLINSGAFEGSGYEGYISDRLFLENINYHFKLLNYPLTQQYLDSLQGSQNERDLSKRDKDYYEFVLTAGLYQGSIYRNQSKINLALDTYKQLEGYVLQHKDSLYDAINSNFSIKRLQAKAYASLGEIDKAILTQIQALEIIKDDPEYSNSERDIELDLTANLIATNELKEAADLIQILEKKNIQKGLFTLRFLDQKIELSRTQNNSSINRLFHQEKLEETLAYRELESHPDMINAYIKYGDDELYWGDIDAAFSKLKKAESLLQKMSSGNENFAISKLQLALAAQYVKTYKASRKETMPDDVLSKTQDIINALEALQPQFESKLDKQYLIDSAYPALQDAFVLMYDLYTATGERIYLDQAFVISEKSKAIELRSIRQAGVAQGSLGIDKKIIEQENLFNYTINQLEKDLFIATENKKELQDSLLQQREAYGDFVYELRDTHRGYYNVRYRNDVATLPQSIDYLSKNSAALSFFQVNNTMYALRIDKKESGITAIPFTEEVQQELRDYYKAISSVKMGVKDQLNALSQSLHKTFIQSSFPEKMPESLTIVPDGLLHYIPFEALQADTRFLVELTTISYKPSISFMQGLYLDETLEAEFFGFAPRFDGDYAHSLATLSYNEEEIEQANAYFKGTIYTGDEGSLSRFRESIANNISVTKTPIYHLATHAIANDTLPEYSYLAFTPKAESGDFILYAKDLYTEQLNGAMVVLSACETGLGKLENGQGMQSLAQGFSYGGASSLVYSKWKVSDRYTADIMGLFYKNLQTGLHKDKALQQAKIQYLSSVDDPNLRHPFYWASFVFSGDATPLKSGSDFTMWLWIIGGLLIVTACGLLLRKQLSRRAVS